MAKRNFLHRQKNKNAFRDREDINPMNYIGNMSDAMLVLAVGIMLALVMAWKVDITSVSTAKTEKEQTESTQDESAKEEQQVELGEIEELPETTESLENSADAEDKTAEDYGLEKYGTVYQDSDGNFYVIEGGKAE